MNFPRLIYSGPPTDDALVKRVYHPADLDRWLAAGWRLTRQVAPETDSEPASARNSDVPENVDQAADVPAVDGAEGEDAKTDPAPEPATDPAPPAAVADAPRPEDTEPIKASNRRKR